MCIANIKHAYNLLTENYQPNFSTDIFRMASAKESSNEKPVEEDEEEEDPYYTILEKSGCAKYHYALQDCYSEKRDWRECKKEMDEFKKCNMAQQKLKNRTKGMQK